MNETKRATNKTVKTKASTEQKKLSKMGEYLRKGEPFLKGVEYDMTLVMQ